MRASERASEEEEEEEEDAAAQADRGIEPLLGGQVRLIGPVRPTHGRGHENFGLQEQASPSKRRKDKKKRSGGAAASQDRRHVQEATVGRG